jgi:cytochrome b pre-mRNA-processing protein 3
MAMMRTIKIKWPRIAFRPSFNRFISTTPTLKNKLPYPDPLSKALHPFGFVKWRMSVIDNARNNYEQCAEQFENSSLETQKDFQDWFALTVLHLWIITKKLDTAGEVANDFKVEMVNHLWLDVEIKLAQAGVKTNITGLVQDLVSTFQGACLAYDEGLHEGDAIFAAALWRNLFHTKDVDGKELLKVVEHVRKHLKAIEDIPIEDIYESKFKFDRL